ncbi:TetR/AcrR family transcriptional regulator [Mycolicibacterium thermoresistibile]
MTTRRPRDRRLTVAREATEMFAARGFGAVRMEDIAAAVGVTARALYRHYPGKQALLFEVATGSQDAYLAALDAGDPAAEPHQRFRTAVAGLTGVTLDGRSHALLWQREARHLDAEQRAVVRGRLTTIVGKIAALIAGYRGAPTTDDTVQLLAWAVLSVLTSPGHHHRALPRPDTDRLLTEAAEALARWRPSSQSSYSPTPFGADPQPTTRRERILVAATRLFAERGFAVVTIEDIGEQAGILGPSVYHHFVSKHAILATLVNRVNEWMTLGVLTARDHAADPADAVQKMTSWYVSLALRFPELVGLTLTEGLYLADSDAEILRRARNDIVVEWAALVQAHRPDLTAPDAILLTETIIALTDDLARTPHLRHDHLGGQITALAAAVLGSGGQTG